MKRLSGLLLISAVLLAGCSSAPAAIPSSTYYELVRESNVFVAPTDDALDSYADEVCMMMRAGDADTSWLFGVKYMTDIGFDAGDAGGFLVYAASYRCPEMIERFPNT